MKIIIILSAFYLSLMALSPYEEYKLKTLKKEKVEVSEEIQTYRDYHLNTIDRRLRSLSKHMDTPEDKERIEEIKECVRTEITKKEILNCVPSILRQN